MKPSPVITTSGLAIGYRQKHGRKIIVHDDISLQLYPGQLTCLLGLNGSGKSTLLRTLSGFQLPLKGEIRILDRPLQNYSQHRLSLTLGVVLTEKTSVGSITVSDLVSLGRHPYTGFFGQLKSHDIDVIQEAMNLVGIAHKANSFVAELSDGERQKAMIAKVLAQECPIVLLDEPTAFLDVTSRIETMLLLHRLAAEQGKAVLLSTHDIELAVQTGDCLWMEETSRPIGVGTPEDLILSGDFGRFFTRKGITFDRLSGKLSIGEPTVPIGIAGDELTVRWVKNALLRNGYHPIAAASSCISVYCDNSTHFRVVLPQGQETLVNNVAGVIECLKSCF